MKAGHTPGPWQYDEDGHFVSVDMDASKMICDIRGWGWLQKMGHAKAIEVQKANAKLIAAAPDLLEALKDAVKSQEIEIRYCEQYMLQVGLEEAKAKLERSLQAIKRATQ